MSGITRQQAIAYDRSVSTNKEIGKRRLLHASAFSIGLMRLSSQKSRLIGNFLAFNHVFGQRSFQFLYAGIPHRNLCVDNGVDYEARPIGCALNLAARPDEPLSILGHKVEQHIAIDQYRGHSIVSGQRHYGVGAHYDITASAQMSNEARTPTFLGLDHGRNDSHDFAVEVEIDLSMGK